MRGWLAVALTLICTAVFGHGSEQWISDTKLVDPVSKAFCCGPTDCSVLAPGSVERVHGGYKVNTGWWAGYDPFFVAWDRALPFSPDGRYHICISYEGEGVIPKVQCFIVPPRQARYDRQGDIQLRCTHCEPPPRRMALMFVSLLTRLPSLLRLVLSWFKAA